MDHEGTETHFNIGAGGYKSCICSCPDCVNKKALCVCEGCSCRNEAALPPLHSAYYPEPVAVLPHPCVICSKEVVRVGSKGRWPSKCVECK